ncbi:MAG: RNA-guided pseudouridylation complex pseudouridine synthase subunit Cbf5 [Candidatus Thermoplasmatota archaeon]|nr:RNA-guided pseudouridylation complex pseudouridine synthase subunit Cbf5 [Candidatus Thermoplasmatota archaeon]
MLNKENKLSRDLKPRRLVKVQVNTNPNFGKRPEERSINELLQNGIINLDKPSGPSSHQVDSWVKSIINVDRIGHGGTLDPNATGVLPIATGDATRALAVLLNAGKEYVGIMSLHKPVDKEKISKACKSFVGEIYQVPPLRSAVKRIRRKRKIYNFEIIQIKERNVLFRVDCEAGTYIRTLCVDIGRKLKCGAHLEELRRTRAGNFIEKNSVTLHQLKDSYTIWKEEKNIEEILSVISPVEYLLENLPKIIIRDSAVDAICHGASIAVPGVAEIDTEIKKEDLIAIFTLKGEGVALAKSLMSSQEIIQKDNGICATTERVLMNKGTYPSIWKKS